MQNQATASPDALDESKLTSRTVYQKKGMRAKSHFRTIAPKIAAEFQPPLGLPYPPSLPDIQTSHLLINGSKSVVMPTHSYALMQVSGQETTYSLVAVPQASSSSPGHSTQSVQMSSISVPENLKLPIPRYQSVRSKANAEKRPVQTTASAMPLKTNRQMQSKTSAQSKCLQPPTVQPEPPPAVESSEQVILIDSSAEEITVATLITDSTSVESKSVLANKRENDKQFASTCLSGLSKQDKWPSLGRQDVSVKQSSDTLVSSNEYAVCPAVKTKKPEEPSAVSANPITVLSPAIFGNAIQLFPSVPKGKIPILPYSRMKKSSLSKAKQIVGVTEKSKSGKEYEKILPACPALTSILGTVVDLPSTMSLQHTSTQANCRSLVVSSEKFDTGVLKRQNPATCKRRGRKRRGSDQIMSTQVKKIKYGSNRMKKCQEKIQMESKESKSKNTEVLKTYRSIRPKVVMQTLTPLASCTNLTPFQTAECVDQELYTLNVKTLTCQKCGSTSLMHPTSCRKIVSRQWFKCHVCSRGFQFKHHLRNHMNTHTNSRPYTCRICRKTYVHSGSLSTHMKLHHGENRLKKKICCGFCPKCFGHVGVYFGHLKEVHKVIVNVVPSPTPQEQNCTLKENEYCCLTTGTEVQCVEKGNNSTVELLPQDSVLQVRLQIRCCHCHLVTPTIADMKLHLLHVHQDKVELRLKEGDLHGSSEAEEELIKHAAHHWKQLNETRNQVQCGSSKDEGCLFSKQKAQTCNFHQDSSLLLTSDSMGVKSFCPNTRAVSQKIISDEESKEIKFLTVAGINCILCKQIFERKENLMLHWQNHHSCENPAVLWHIFNSFFEHEVIEESERSTENKTSEN